MPTFVSLVPRSVRTRLIALAGVLALAAATNFHLVSANESPTVATEDAVYAGGDEVMVRAHGFAPFETVALSVVHADGTAESGRGHEPLTVSADSAGSFTEYWSLDAADSAGREFVVRASGAVSGVSVSPVFIRAPRVEPATRRVTFGQPLSLRGRDFVPGETVTVQVVHADSGVAADAAPVPATVAAADGTFSASWTGDVADAGGPTLSLLVSGSVSGPIAPLPLTRAAAIRTDKADYMPGETASIVGAGFGPGEVVEVQVRHLTGPTGGNGHAPFYVSADAEGGVATTWFVDPDDSLGATFVLSGKGSASGAVAEWVFTDAGSPTLVIGQVYGAGGNTGAVFTNDYIQIFNRSASTVSLNGLSLQYASATGTGTLGSSGLITVLPNVSLQPGQYYLVKQAGGANGVAFTSDFTPASGAINMSGTAGKVALVNATTGLGCNGGSTPCTAAQQALIVDLLGFGSANFFEGTGAAPTLAATTAATRKGAGCTDTDDNAADFTAATLSSATPPLTSASPLNACAAGSPVLSVNDVSASEGDSGTTTFTFTVGLSAPAGAGGVLFDIATADNTATTANSDYVAAALSGQSIPAGSSTFSFDVTVNGDTALEPTETFFVNVTNVTGATAGDTQGQGTIVTDDIADAAPSVSSTSPANGASGVAVSSNLTVTFSEPVNVAAPWFTLACGGSAVTATVSGGPTTFTLDPDADFGYLQACTLTVLASQVTDQDANDPPDAMLADATASFTTVAPPVHIYDIQGAAHRSPLESQVVTTTPAVVTALRTVTGTRGFYVQELVGDGNDATSDGVFVFTGSGSNPASLVSVGDLVSVRATVTEFRASGSGARSLTITELTSPTVTKLSTGNPLPAAVLLGGGGRVIPDTVIENDAANVETGGTFDPAEDGIDFWESLEGMLVQGSNAVVVGPTSDFTSNREVPVLLDNGAGAGVRTARGGIVIRPTDFNPERIILNDLITGGATLPSANVADSFPGTVTGVIDYSFSNPKLEVITLPALVSGGLTQETTTAQTVTQLAVATFNVENLAGTDPPAKFAALAAAIVQNLQAPDVLAIEEIQDSNGTTNNGNVSAATTWSTLIAAIQAAGGPLYDYRQIDPVNGQDGGAPGGNIRQGFLFRTDRGLSFVDRPGATSTTANAVVGSGTSTALLYSPGRIDPTNVAFASSRKPLAGEFTFRGQRVFVIANHFNSKGGDDALYGFTQPPVLVTEAQRLQQAQVEAAFVSQLLAADPLANIVVLGDLNDFEFSAPVGLLKAAGLNALIETLPQEERYSYVFEGNSQTLDHIMVSGNLFSNRPFDYDVVHINAEFAAQISDHDPQVVRLTLNDAPSASAGGPYSVDEGSSVTLDATGSDPEGDALTYAWDLDDNGSFETAGQSVTFSAALLDGPGSHAVAVQVTDIGGLSTVSTTTVSVLNVAPTVASPVLSAEPSVEGQGVTASASFTDPGTADAPFTCTVDYGDGLGISTGTVSAGTCLGPSHTYAAAGVYTVTVRVTDRDGGAGSATVSHDVNFAFAGFFAPVDAMPVVNRVKAGQAIPFKFRLGGNRGLNILGSVTSAPLNCSTSALIDDVEATVTAGGSSLQYDAATAQYAYVWKTDKAWAGQCRLFTLTTSDGVVHSALFSFPR